MSQLLLVLCSWSFDRIVFLFLRQSVKQLFYSGPAVGISLIHGSFCRSYCETACQATTGTLKAPQTGKQVSLDHTHTHTPHTVYLCMYVCVSVSVQVCVCVCGLPTHTLCLLHLLVQSRLAPLLLWPLLCLLLRSLACAPEAPDTACHVGLRRRCSMGRTGTTVAQLSRSHPSRQTPLYQRESERGCTVRLFTARPVECPG